jgi:hypothetical protein
VDDAVGLAHLHQHEVGGRVVHLGLVVADDALTADDALRRELGVRDLAAFPDFAVLVAVFEVDDQPPADAAVGVDSNRWTVTE